MEPPVRTLIFVPWRPNGGMRDRVWEHCRKQWDGRSSLLRWGGDLTFSDGPRPFNRAAAINFAGAQYDWDAMCVVDADILHDDPACVDRALELAHASNAYVSPHAILRYAGEDTTERILKGEPVNLHELPSMHQVWTGGFAVSRELWDRVQGFDPAFTTYGAEDLAFFYACSALGDDEPQRLLDGGVTHLHHEDVGEHGWCSPAWEANVRRARIYESWIDDPQGMRELIARRQ